MASQISIQTGIDIDILREDTSNLSSRLETLSVAQRMSWAANRRTSRQEDRAYSLLGLFNVNMPLLYGEGQKAFMRLQHEIMKQAVDLSILAWSYRCPQEKAKGLQLLAMTPDDFADCRSMILDNEGIDRTSVEVEIISSSRGIRVTAPVMIVTDESTHRRRRTLLLGCRRSDDLTTTAALKIDSFTNDSVKDSLEFLKRQSATCVRGWNQYDDEADVIFVDTLDAAKQSKPVAIELRGRRDIVPRHVGDRKLLWVRFNDVAACHTWSIIDLHPIQYWDRRNRTFDIAGARKDAVAAEDTANSERRESNPRPPVFAAIALKNGPTEMSIYLHCWQKGALPKTGIMFGVAPYDEKDFQQTESQLRDSQRRYTFNDGRTVKLEIHDQVIGGTAVAQLAVEVFEGE